MWEHAAAILKGEEFMNTHPVHKFEIVIVYNGLEKSVEVNAHQAVQAVLQHAIKEFGITQNAHILSLFNEKGEELNDNTSVLDAGIKPGDRLLLRPSVVKGGAR